MNVILSKYVVNILGEIIQTTLDHRPRLPFQNMNNILFNRTSPMAWTCVWPSTQQVLTKCLYRMWSSFHALLVPGVVGAMITVYTSE